MKRGLFSGLLLWSCASFAQSVFFDTYPDAKETVLGVYENMDVLKKLPDDQGKIIFSIVAPEVSMYSGFIDELETVSAEVFYTNFGKEYGNFSVGQFQMKPSFAEDVERAYREECTACAYLETLRYTGISDEVDTRSARVDRLKMDSWQQVYLLCFYEIMEARHGNKSRTTRDRIAFYASAYNYGFNAPDERIEAWMDQHSFPGNMQEKLVSYGDLAADFFLVLRPDLANETLADRELMASFTGAGSAITGETAPPLDLTKANNRIQILPGLLVFIAGFVVFSVVYRSRRDRSSAL